MTAWDALHLADGRAIRVASFRADDGRRVFALDLKRTRSNRYSYRRLPPSLAAR